LAGALLAVRPSLLQAQEARRETRRSGEISAEEFTSGTFAKFFTEGDYEAALRALAEVQKKYPGDPLVKRYRGVVLSRLGRSAEAIRIFEELLKETPNHVPTRLNLGEAYYRAGNSSAATREWKWVAENSPTEVYREQARAYLQRPPIQPAQVRLAKTSWYASAGVEYDSNPLLKPDDKRLATAGNEKRGFRLVLNLGLTHPLVSDRDHRVDLIYTARQSFHDGETDSVDFTSQEVGINARKKDELLGKDVTWGARYDLAVGFLRSDLFSVINRFLFSSDWTLTPQTRTRLYDRFSISEFGPDGSNPDQTSRDGVSNDIGVTQYFYSGDFRSYLFITEEFNQDNTRGGNFKQRGTTTRIGVHTAFLGMPRSDFDASVGYGFGRYPGFSSLSSADLNRRVDKTLDFYSAVTHHLTPAWAARLFYRFINAENENGFFDYKRNIAGIQFLYSQ